jgi:hypothetical protein
VVDVINLSQNAFYSAQILGGAPLDLINGHLTDDYFVPVDRSLPYNPVGWFRPVVGYTPDKPFHYVAKIQAFASGGYEVTCTRQDLKRLASLSDIPRSAPVKREKGEQNENDVVSSILRSKRKVRHLIKSMGCDRLLTLTRRENDSAVYWTVDDWKAAWDRFNRSCKKMGVTLAYVAVLEKHKKGNYHMHAAIVGHINVKHIRALWWSCCGGRGMGNVDIKCRHDLPVYQRRAGLARYVSKYITKQAEQVEFNKKRYWASRHQLPALLRLILKADDAVAALAEIASFMALDASKLFQAAFMFDGGMGAWFSFDDDLADSPPF